MSSEANEIFPGCQMSTVVAIATPQYVPEQGVN